MFLSQKMFISFTDFTSYNAFVVSAAGRRKSGLVKHVQK